VTLENEKITKNQIKNIEIIN